MIMIFETERLYARKMGGLDRDGFFELMGNPNVMKPIPQKPFSKEQSDAELSRLIALEKTSDTKIWALCEKNTNQFIGIGGLTKNDEYEDEIAYRLIETFWGKGYGTEIASRLIDFCFEIRKSAIVTADVNVENLRSVKILEKFFTVQKEFFNPNDNCVDRRYAVHRESWIK